MCVGLPGRSTYPVCYLSLGHDVDVGVIQQLLAKVLVQRQVGEEPAFLPLQGQHTCRQTNHVLRHLVQG